MTPRVSVVVLNFNGAHLLPECLQSLAAQDYPDLEILVVDNASQDESRQVVRRYPNVRWVGLPVNEGLGPGYNRGAKQAGGDKLFFVNNDTRFEPSCVHELVKAFEDPQLLAADPMQLSWDGTRVIHGAQRFRWGWRHWRSPVPFLDPYQENGATQVTEVPWAGAGATMFDRAKFEALGGFDSTFFLDYEDLDICWRGWLQGWKTIFVPSARLRHRVGETGITLRRKLSQYQNVQRFILKTMSWPVVAGSSLVEAGKILGAFLSGRPSSGLLRIQAGLRNLRALAEIMAHRRSAAQGAVTTSFALLKRWGDAE